MFEEKRIKVFLYYHFCASVVDDNRDDICSKRNKLMLWFICLAYIHHFGFSKVESSKFTNATCSSASNQRQWDVFGNERAGFWSKAHTKRIVDIRHHFKRNLEQN